MGIETHALIGGWPTARHGRFVPLFDCNRAGVVASCQMLPVKARFQKSNDPPEWQLMLKSPDALKGVDQVHG